MVDSITPEKMMRLGGLFVGTRYSYNTYDGNAKYKDMWIYPNDVDMDKTIEPGKDDIDFGGVVYVCNEALDKHQHFRDHTLHILSRISRPFVLILHNGDHGFDEDDMCLFDLNSNLRAVFTQNINVKPSSKVIPVPIGLYQKNIIPYSFWDDGKTIPLLRDKPKTDFILFQFNVGTNLKKRAECRDALLRKGLHFIEMMECVEYMYKLSECKYNVCPEGNGIDTYRMWESLYLKVVPICKRNILVEYFANYFPIVILDEWSDFDREKLEQQYSTYNWDNYHMLDMKYYTDFIKNMASQLS